MTWGSSPACRRRSSGFTADVPARSCRALVLGAAALRCARQERRATAVEPVSHRLRLIAMRRRGRSLVGLALVLLLAGCGAEEEAEPAGAWSRAGTTVADDLIESGAGPAHCGWQSAHFLHISWPPGSFPAHRADRRVYIRDPEGVLPEGQVQARFQADAALPADARPTGYENDGRELWFAPGDEDATAYLVTEDGDTVEAWPRATRGYGCA